MITIFSYWLESKSFIHSIISSSPALDENRFPSSQLPVPAMSANSLLLSPSPELAEVQKGITVLSVKSFASINPFTGHAAIPHQIGY